MVPKIQGSVFPEKFCKAEMTVPVQKNFPVGQQFEQRHRQQQSVRLLPYIVRERFLQGLRLRHQDSAEYEERRHVKGKDDGFPQPVIVRYMGKEDKKDQDSPCQIPHMAPFGIHDLIIACLPVHPLEIE